MSVKLQTNSIDLYKDLIQRAQKLPPLIAAVVSSNDKFSFESSIQAAEKNIIRPIFIGYKSKIKKMAEEISIDINKYEVIESESPQNSAQIATDLSRNGIANAIIKGQIHTDELMVPIIHREKGLRIAQTRMSHVFLVEYSSEYHKPIMITDAAININPDLMTKVSIVQNSANLFLSIYRKIPKIAILSAVETVTERIPSTIDASALCKMADRNQIQNCIIDGPLAFDNAISLESAITKGFNSKVAGDPDILVVPNIEAGNMIYKQMRYISKAEGVGLVIGAKVPIILTSRSEEDPVSRIASCAMASIYNFNSMQNS